ncbi:MAG: small multi-drug export protein, partial [Firmicutes bacterium]|nr:small multi-drug export protein [Bacillota bacterium]
PMFGIRGGMTASYFLRIHELNAVIYCVLGNFIPVPFIFAFGRFIKDIFKRKHIFENAITRLEKKSGDRDDLIKKYGFLGIVLFIALPLPGTGAYMGTFIASVSDMPVKKAVFAVICGMLLSACIMAAIVSAF